MEKKLDIKWDENYSKESIAIVRSTFMYKVSGADNSLEVGRLKLGQSDTVTKIVELEEPIIAK